MPKIDKESVENIIDVLRGASILSISRGKKISLNVETFHALVRLRDLVNIVEKELYRTDL